MLKRILAALALASLVAVPIYAQSNKTAQISQIASCFPNNTSGAITPAIVVSCLSNIVNSYQQFSAVNAQTGTSYAIAVNDYGQLVTLTNTSAVAVSLPQAAGPFQFFNVYVKNLGAGLVTITPVTSTINGAASFALAQNQSVWIVSDGANWQVWNSNTVPASFPAQSANTVFAGPTSGSAAVPSFRSLVGADLPTPAAASLGGVFSFTAPSHQFITTIATSGQVSSAQPAFSDVSGQTVLTQLPSIASNTILGNIIGSTTSPQALNPGQVGSILCTPVRTIETSGSATYAVPSCNAVLATWLEVDVQGGGAGGGGSGTTLPAGTAGNASTFGGLTASGGNAASANSNVGGTGGACSGTLGIQQNFPGSAGNSTSSAGASNAPSGAGGTSFYGGYGAQTANTNAGLAAPANSGGGGSGGGGNTTAGVVAGPGGGAGCHIKTVITNPSATFSFSVGGTASGGSAGTSGATGGAGAAGLIDIIAHWQ